jgi:hypothetical protein
MSAFAKTMTKGVLTAAMATALLAVATTAEAQYTEHWRIEGTPYLSGALTRGMDYNAVTDTVLVAHRSSGNNVIRVNAADGTILNPPMNTTGISGGLLTLTKLEVVELGGNAYSVYATAATSDINGVTADSQVLRVYRWHSDGAGGVITEDALGAPTRIYFNRTVDNPPAGEEPTGAAFPSNSYGITRIGDSMKATTSGGVTTLYFGCTRATTNVIAKLTVDEATGTVTSASFLDVPEHTGTTSYGVAPEPSGNFYYFTNGTQMARRYDSGGNLLGTFDLSVVPQSSVQPRYMEFGGRSFVGFVLGQDSPTYSSVRVAEVTAGVDAATIHVTSAKATTPASNGNGAGEVTLDTARNRFIGLATDNFIISFSMEEPLLIELASLGASVNEPSGTVTINWETASEIDNVGFNVYRAADNSKVNAILIPSAGNGASYSLVDSQTLAPGASRSYILEDIDANGTVKRHAPVTATRAANASSVTGWPQF